MKLFVILLVSFVILTTIIFVPIIYVEIDNKYYSVQNSEKFESLEITSNLSNRKGENYQLILWVHGMSNELKEINITSAKAFFYNSSAVLDLQENKDNKLIINKNGNFITADYRAHKLIAINSENERQPITIAINVEFIFGNNVKQKKFIFEFIPKRYQYKGFVSLSQVFRQT